VKVCILALCVATALAGCITPPKAEVVTVQVKVKEPCIAQVPKRPAYQTGKGAYPGDAAAAKILATDFERAEQYGTDWEAASAGCLVLRQSEPAAQP
jgi:hypothetical protein